MLGFVLSVLIAFQGAATPTAESTLADQLHAAAVYDGQEILAIREYRPIEGGAEGDILLVQATVRVFGAEDEAAAALSESVEANLESDSFVNLEEQDDPGIGDESQAFAGELPSGGNVGVVFVVQDAALYRFIGASIEPDPLTALLEATEVWIADASDVGDVEDGDGALDLLPDEDAVFEDFAVTEEGTATYNNEDEDEPATPAA